MGEALPSGWFTLGDWICEDTHQCNCGMGAIGAYYGHEPMCGIEPVMTVTEWNERGQADDQCT